MQESCTFQTGINKGGLHAGQYATYLALVYVANQTTTACTFYEDFLQHTVFHDGHTGLPRRDIDEYFLAHAILPVNTTVFGFAAYPRPQASRNPG
jgi:hypothetical protein